MMKSFTCVVAVVVLLLGICEQGAAIVSGTIKSFSVLPFQLSIWINGKDEMFVSTLDSINKIDTNGNISVIASITGFDSPMSLTGDALGNVFFTDNSFNVIFKVDSSHFVSTYVGRGYSTVDGAAGNETSISYTAQCVSDPSGNVYYSDLFNNLRMMSSTTGKVTTIVSGQYYYYMFFHSLTNTMYATTSNGGYIYKIDLTKSNTVTTVAGNGGTTDSGDEGSALTAGFGQTCTITGDDAGNLFIVSPFNFYVRVIDTSGQIYAFAGQSGSQGSTSLSLSEEVKEGPATDIKLNPLRAYAHKNVLYISDVNGQYRAVSYSTPTSRTISSESASRQA